MVNLLNKRFGRLIVIQKGKIFEGQHQGWICKCDCGNTKELNGKFLRRGDTKSCGCLLKDTISKSPGYTSYRKFYYTYRQGAKQRDMEFNLTIDEFQKIVVQNCHYCGCEPKDYNGYFLTDKSRLIHNISTTLETAHAAWIKVNGIDRLDNNKSYTIENSVPCCTICNFMKKVLSKDEFLAHIERIYNHSIESKSL